MWPPLSSKVLEDPLPVLGLDVRKIERSLRLQVDVRSDLGKERSLLLALKSHLVESARKSLLNIQCLASFQRQVLGLLVVVHLNKK